MHIASTAIKATIKVKMRFIPYPPSMLMNVNNSTTVLVYDQLGSLSSGCSTGGSTRTVSGYINPLPVFNSTTRSSELIQPDSRSFIAALKVAAPSGQMNVPSAPASWAEAFRIASSETAMAQPSVL